MDRSTSTASPSTVSSSTPRISAAKYADKVDAVAQTAHTQADRLAETANAQVERVRGSAHRAVDSASAAAMSTAERASSFINEASSLVDQAKQTRATLVESASSSIRARPITAVASVLVVGYLLGRLAKL